MSNTTKKYLDYNGLEHYTSKIEDTMDEKIEAIGPSIDSKVSSVSYNSTAKKISYTLGGGGQQDVVSTNQLKTDMELATVASSGSYNDLSDKIEFASDQEVRDILFPPVKLPVGGRIFYIHNDNGAIYHFFDTNDNELTTQTVAGLANAVTYTVSGTPSADKFYVYDNSGTSPTDNLKWATSQDTIGATADTIGSGKTNTATAMQTASTQGSGTVFYWATNLTVGGCNDWYIGSRAEYDKLRESGLVTWFSSYYIWSSVEISSTNAYHWLYTNSSWFGNRKTNPYKGVALRSF